MAGPFLLSIFAILNRFIRKVIALKDPEIMPQFVKKTPFMRENLYEYLFV